MGELDAEEVERLAGAAYRSGRAEDFAALIRAVSTAPPPVTARDYAVVGGAWLVSYKFSQRLEDLDRALGMLQVAHEREPTPARATNLAGALLERRGWPGTAGEQTGALAEALQLLRAAVAVTDRKESAWVPRATSLLSALLDAAESGSDGLLDEALDLGQELFDATQPDHAGWQEAASLFGSALRVAADRGHRRGDVARAVQLLRLAVDGTPADDLDWPARASNLASALIEAADGTGRHPMGADAAARYARAALERLDPGEPAWPQAANNLVNALLLEHTVLRRVESLHEARDLLPAMLERLPPPHPLRPIAASNAGLVLRAVAEETSDAAALEDAVWWHREALRLTVAGSPMEAGRQASLAHALSDRFDARGEEADLEEAIALGAAAVRSGGAPRHEQAAFLSNLGNHLHERYRRAGRLADLQQACNLFDLALSILDAAHPVSAALLNNAGNAFNARYNRLGDPADLIRAAGCLTRAGSADSPAPDRAVRLANLATTLLDVYGHTGREEDLVAAERAARAALPHARPAARRLALATLVDALRHRRDDFADASVDEEYRQARDDLLRGAPATPAARLRRALSAPAGERARLLAAVAAETADSRPAVALAAARQLALDAVADLTTGRANDDADAAHELAEASAQRLIDQPTPRESIAWLKEARGLGAALAQAHLLRGDPSGAADAHDHWSARLLTRSLPAAPAASTVTVTTWHTPYGGGAVVHRHGEPPAAVRLPRYTTMRADAWVRRLQTAARLGGPSLRRALFATASAMGNAVVGPVADLLLPGETVAWCASGAAATLPWPSARLASGQTLLASHPIRFSTTRHVAAWAEAAATARGSARSLDCAWSVSDPAPSTWPPLPGAHAEAAAFAAPERSLLGSDATVEAARDAAAAADLLHVACHAVTNTPDPLANHLLLANDAPWYADDIRQGTSPARLVVLSACDTASIGAAHADEGLGLPAAFHLAGVPGVVAALWPVPDRRTVDLMRQFVLRLRAGDAPALALRDAATAADRRGQSDIAAAFVLWGA